MKVMTCADLHDVAAEFALDALTGASRGAAIAHLERCSGCRDEVSSLADAADLLLLAAPHVDPPAGFESRVLARITSEHSAERDQSRVSGSKLSRRPRSERRRWLWAIPIAVLAAVAGLLFIAGLDGGRVESASADMRTATGETVGQVVVDGSRPALITLDMPRWNRADYTYGGDAETPYWLAVERADGTTSLVSLRNDSGTTWYAAVDDAGPADLVGVAVVDGQQRIWCLARFDP